MTPQKNHYVAAPAIVLRYGRSALDAEWTLQTVPGPVWEEYGALLMERKEHFFRRENEFMEYLFDDEAILDQKKLASLSRSLQQGESFAGELSSTAYAAEWNRMLRTSERLSDLVATEVPFAVRRSTLDICLVAENIRTLFEMGTQGDRSRYTAHTQHVPLILTDLPYQD